MTIHFLRKIFQNFFSGPKIRFGGRNFRSSGRKIRLTRPKIPSTEPNFRFMWTTFLNGGTDFFNPENARNDSYYCNYSSLPIRESWKFI